MFEESLGRVVSRVEGAFGAAVMSVEGLAIEAVDDQGQVVDVEEASSEYASIFKQLLGAAEMGLGEMDEVTFQGADRTTLVRLLTPRYFVALQMPAGGSPGQGRYELRLAAPDLAREL